MEYSFSMRVWCRFRRGQRGQGEGWQGGQQTHSMMATSREDCLLASIVGTDHLYRPHRLAHRLTTQLEKEAKATHRIESRGSGCPVPAMCLYCPLLAKFNTTPAAQAITVNTPEVQIWNRKLISGTTLEAILTYTIRTCLNKQTSRFPSHSTKQRKRVTSKPVGVLLHL